MDSREQTPCHVACRRRGSVIVPPIGWTYNNEDYMGKTSLMGMSVRHGLTAAKRSEPLMKKYGSGMTLKWLHETHFPEDIDIV